MNNITPGSKNGGAGSANGPAKNWQPPEPIVDALVAPAVRGTLSVKENQDLGRLERIIKDGWNNFLAVGHALMQISKDKLYRDKYETFAGYCRQEFEFSRSHAYNLIGGTEVYDQVSAIADIGVKPANEAQTRCLISLPEGKRVAAWKEAVKLAGAKPVTASLVKKVAAKFKPKESREKTKVTKKATASNYKTALDLVDEIERLVDKGNQKLLKKVSALRNCLQGLE